MKAGHQPYCRRLDKQERDNIWQQLDACWDLSTQFWYPLRNAVLPDRIKARGVIAFDMDAVDDALLCSIIRTTLSSHGIERAWVLGELCDDGDYEIDVATLDPFYGSGDEIMGEKYITSQDMEWLIYASHEHTLTFAGSWLVQAIMHAYHNWEQCVPSYAPIYFPAETC